jgi:type III pantothenate kinase
MLAIDCGNSMIKWARLNGGRIENRSSGPVAAATTFAALAEALSADAGGVLVANVAGTEVADRIAGLVTSVRGFAPEFVRVLPSAYGIECAYREPQTLGIDRWLAMIAARRRARGSLVVVGCGTAVTIDAVDAAGRHLGGLILPGDRLMLEALAAGTRQIGLVPRAGEPPDGLELLGRSTEEAVAHGSRLALAAAIDRAVRVLAEALPVAPQLFLSGGDAMLLAPWLESEAQVSADLVLEGLGAIAAAPE